MQKFILDQTNLSQLVFDNKYVVDSKTNFLSRCIDGRYKQVESLPALAFPGADPGELALIFATARGYGFTVDPEKAYQALIEVIGGEKNFQLHTDSHNPGILSGCGHVKQMTLGLIDYQLTEDELNFVKEKSAQVVKNGAVEIILHGEHGEGAVVYIRGNYGIYPQYLLKLEDGREINVQIFIYHTTLVDARHRKLANVLLKNKAVKLSDGCDEEWLYDALSDTAEIQTLETAKRLAKGLPIFQVVFDEEGMFKIKDMGTV